MWVVVVFVCAWHYYGDRHCVSVYNWKRYQNAGAEEEPTLYNINYAIGTHSRAIQGTLQIRPPSIHHATRWMMAAMWRVGVGGGGKRGKWPSGIKELSQFYFWLLKIVLLDNFYGCTLSLLFCCCSTALLLRRGCWAITRMRVLYEVGEERVPALLPRYSLLLPRMIKKKKKKF